MNNIEKDPNFLLKTMDAKIWTEEFIKIYPNGPDFDTMIAWFANAIMTGYDHAYWKYSEEYKKFQQELNDPT